MEPLPAAAPPCASPTEACVWTSAMTARANWREAASCRDADPDLFFPIGTTGPALRQVEKARRTCLTRPARTQ